MRFLHHALKRNEYDKRLQQDMEKRDKTSIESAHERSRAFDVTLARLYELMRRPASFPVASRINPYVNDTLLSPVTAIILSFFFSSPLTTACDDTVVDYPSAVHSNRAVSRAKRNGVATRRDPRVAISCNHSKNMNEVRTCKRPDKRTCCAIRN